LVNPADDFIADIVDSKKKFKHLEDLTTSDIMIPLDKNTSLPPIRQPIQS